MNIALPILLLVFGGLTFWLLTESQLKWYFKATCISVFCVFTVLFWSTIHTFLGWAANEEDMPDKILIHWVIIKEPNKFTKSKGTIYILLQSAEEIKANKVSKFFGYNKNKTEPRLFKLGYTRQLHERLEGLKDKLKQGQPVAGRLTRGDKNGGKEKGKSNKKGDGSESQEQEWHFHELLPSDIHRKPNNNEG